MNKHINIYRFQRLIFRIYKAQNYSHYQKPSHLYRQSWINWTTTSSSACIGPLHLRQTINTTRKKMATDEDYMAFLNKANQDADDAHAAAAATSAGGQVGGKAAFKAVDSSEAVPQQIKDACKDAVYVTDADEPFHQVSLRYTGTDGLPDEVEFAKLIHHWDPDNAEITIMDPVEWDVQGQYTALIEAVRQASKGNDVRVYSVVRDSTRTEYWVVTTVPGQIVGVKALGVES